MSNLLYAGLFRNWGPITALAESPQPLAPQIWVLNGVTAIKEAFREGWNITKESLRDAISAVRNATAPSSVAVNSLVEFNPGFDREERLLVS